MGDSNHAGFFFFVGKESGSDDIVWNFGGGLGYEGNFGGKIFISFLMDTISSLGTIPFVPLEEL